jgi:exopolyphosphatase/guanosine-5'-triphosphate,3'-diphosphate pyrophosphatase
VTEAFGTRREKRIVHLPRAVIDIGSNTVRMVIYEGSPRAPRTVWNEKVAAKLGRDLSTTGLIPEEARDEALVALARYKRILDDLGVTDVQTVATAAARDAENGADFLAAVAELGLDPRLLSGEEEARISATGAIGAFPGANGVVADLGGGSLELVSIRDGECHQASSLPLGTLRLPALDRSDKKKFAKRVRTQLDKVGWAAAHPGPLYMVGGTWRAFAAYAMMRRDYPLSDPHGFRLAVEEADRLAQRLVSADPETLAQCPGISQMRAEYLPDAAALLRPLLDALEPDELVFSSWGIREGLLFDRLDPVQRAKDPLIAGVSEFATMLGAAITDALLVAGWSVELAANGGAKGHADANDERLRLAAAQLSDALQRVEPNLRLSHASAWSLDKRWIDCKPSERAKICAALYASLGRTDYPERLLALADKQALRDAVTWGLGFRLARRLGGGSRPALSASRLQCKKQKLVLRIDPSRAQLAHYPITRDLENLASWLGVEAKLKIAPTDTELDEIEI